MSQENKKQDSSLILHYVSTRFITIKQQNSQKNDREEVNSGQPENKSNGQV